MKKKPTTKDPYLPKKKLKANLNSLGTIYTQLNSTQNAYYYARYYCLNFGEKGIIKPLQN